MLLRHTPKDVAKCAEENRAVSGKSECTGWVSVEEQLPKESGKYRVMINRGSAKVTTEETETLFFKKVHRSYWGIGGDWDVVTHWKPNDKMNCEVKND